jgi:ABC-type transporter Mla subunit MlaD
MTGTATHFKLGLLAIIALVALVATGFVLGLRATRKPTVTYHVYFDESVQGLDSGSPVKFRGVQIGSVSGIRIAPDGRFVDVSIGLDATESRLLDVDALRPELRAQLGIQGLTGVKFIDIDFFEDAKPEELPFPPARRHIATQPSLLKGLESGVNSVGRRVPALIDRAMGTLETMDRILADIDRAGIPRRVVDTLDSVNQVADQARRVLARVDRSKLPGKLERLVARFDTTMTKVNAALDQIGGTQGLIATTRDTAATLGQLGHRATSTTAEIDRTMRDLGDAAQALRDLLDELERSPDMLLKGRARTGRP